ncbi:hypothetical protein [uncultured Sphingomonas sp.]|uniref:hypothetical protein n=1 Tax=uncultured Sphingomonas sp. TaxID=158754 RepID=UPI003747D23A
MSKRLRRIRIVVSAFAAVTIFTSLIPASSLIAYERTANRAGYEKCQGDDGYGAFVPVAGGSKKQQSNQQKNDAAARQRDSAGKELGPAFAVACQANAIMRVGLRLQVLTFIASVVPLLLGPIGVFVSIWLLAREEDVVISPSAGGSEVEDKAVDSRDVHQVIDAGTHDLDVQRHIGFSSVIAVTAVILLASAFRKK